MIVFDCQIMIRPLKEKFEKRNYKQFLCKPYEKRDMFVKKDNNGLFITICLLWNEYVDNAFSATIYYYFDTRAFFTFLNRNVAELTDREDYWWDIESEEDIVDFFNTLDMAEEKIRCCTDIEYLKYLESTDIRMEIDKEIIRRFLNKTEPAPVEHVIKRDVKTVPLILFHLAEDVLREKYPDNGIRKDSMTIYYYSEYTIISHALEAYRQILLM